MPTTEKKHWTQNRSATDRMQAARAAHLETRTRELLLAAICTRIWPAFMTPPKRKDEMFPRVLHIESPAGRLAYRLAVGDVQLFKHVEYRDAYDPTPCTQDDKFARLLHLAREGW